MATVPDKSGNTPTDEHIPSPASASNAAIIDAVEDVKASVDAQTPILTTIAENTAPAEE